MNGPRTPEERERRIRLWTAALTSGEYPQTTGSLRDRRGFCCLGVACEVYRKETGEGVWIEDVEWRFLGHEGDLPTRVAEWLLGDQWLTDPAVDVVGVDSPLPLSVVNDRRVPFTDIADLIETQLLEQPPPPEGS